MNCVSSTISGEERSLLRSRIWSPAASPNGYNSDLEMPRASCTAARHETNKRSWWRPTIFAAFPFPWRFLPCIYKPTYAWAAQQSGNWHNYATKWSVSWTPVHLVNNSKAHASTLLEQMSVSLQQSPAEFGLHWEGCWVSHWRFPAAECLSDSYSAVETEENFSLAHKVSVIKYGLVGWWLAHPTELYSTMESVQILPFTELMQRWLETPLLIMYVVWLASEK